LAIPSGCWAVIPKLEDFLNLGRLINHGASLKSGRLK
jgi:hypothetical protein